MSQVSATLNYFDDECLNISEDDDEVQAVTPVATEVVKPAKKSGKKRKY